MTAPPLGVAAVGPAPAAPLPAGTVAGTPPPAGTPTLAAQLKDLGRLHADGVLTDAEFAAAKARLIGR
jgi:Short C-terminal domain